eukprot:TRINITY_DN23173_c0_g1_i3.p2 TRINITY_DN23173_c0_g1~~TRINITY_DN23173_c0_g1_i3.p2  ORF type:complete len:160 (+),score=37.37 TRINITY_DN23173_c0_g1_i3:99-578(+)
MCIRDSINAEYMGYFLMGKECQGTLHKDIKKRAPKHITNIEEITCEFTKQWCSEYIRKEHVIEDGKITVIVRTPGKRDVSIMMKELKIKENSYASILRLLKCRGAVSKACRWYFFQALRPVSYTHLRAHETSLHLVCRLLLEKKKKRKYKNTKKVTTEK